MKNFVFISPNFPTNFWQFCKELKNNGLNVLGIGDQPYNELAPEVRDSVNEYYKVDTLEDYDQVYRAVAFFIHKYGRIDWLESNNEYWLMQDAQLRTDFNITSGFRNDDIDKVKYKSLMKEYYAKAGLPTARYHMVDNKEGCLKFIEEVGYPVVVKPDNGVGAEDTWRISNEEDLDNFLAHWDENVPYIMEEYVYATINSYDAIIDSNGEPIFELGNVSPVSLMDIMNTQDNCIFYIVNDLAPDVRAAGRSVVKSFGVKSRYIHFEFFRLDQDEEGLGKKGDLVGLEVNMRPSGGFSPDMMNFANGVDVFKIYADMIAYDGTDMKQSENEHFYCGYAGLRDEKQYKLTDEDIMQKYGPNMKMTGRMPEALSDIMANRYYIANFKTREEMDEFYKDLFEEV